MNSILRHIRQSLSTKLSLSIMLTAVPIFVVALGILYSQSSQFIRDEAEKRVSEVLNNSLQRTVKYLNTIETATISNAWIVEANMEPESLLGYSRRVVELNAHVNGCSITTEPYFFPQYGKYFSAYTVRQGDTIITAREAEYDYHEKIWYKKAARQNSACWTDPFDDYNEGTLSATGTIASYCFPLHDDKGNLIGVMATGVSMEKVSDAITSEKPYPNAYFMLLGESGTFFVHPDSTLLGKYSIFTGTDAQTQQDIITLGHEMTKGKSGNMQVNFDGKPCLVCYRSVPDTKWSLALVCPLSDILEGYKRTGYVILAFLIIGLLIILMFIHHIVANAIKPLNKLAGLSQNIAAGHYDVHIPQSSRKDVVGRLQNSFASMQASLREHVSAIKATNAKTLHRNEQLRQAQLSAVEAIRQKTLFIQNMTHQIRTPLNIIMGFSQVMRDFNNELSTEEVGSITAMMDHNTRTLTRMTTMLYDSSDTGQAEEKKCQKTDEISCVGIVRESVESVYEHFPGLEISFETDLPESFCIISNRLYLMKSIREILYNSAKYSDGKHISIKLSKTDTVVRFVFEDTGPGISKDYFELMFRPFTKVNDLSEGLGLGLPLAKQHIRNLGGDLVFDKGYTQGCRFVVEIPIKANKPSEAS